MSREDLGNLGDVTNTPEGQFERFEDDLTLPGGYDFEKVKRALLERFGENARVSGIRVSGEGPPGTTKYHYIVFRKKS